MHRKESLGYALGGIGHNLIYALFSGYLLVFYTDVFGLSAGFIALLFLVARIFDTVNDPIMGIIADKTNSRFGHYRIWLMISGPIVALALILCFCAPDRICTQRCPGGLCPSVTAWPHVFGSCAALCSGTYHHAALSSEQAAFLGASAGTFPEAEG